MILLRDEREGSVEAFNPLTEAWRAVFQSGEKLIENIRNVYCIFFHFLTRGLSSSYHSDVQHQRPSTAMCHMWQHHCIRTTHYSVHRDYS